MLFYKITDPKYYSQNPTKFLRTLRSSKRSDFVSLRDKKNPKLRKLAKRFRSLPLEATKILHQDIELAKRFGFKTIHLGSAQIDKIKRLHRAGFFVIFSAHTLDEIKRAKAFRADLMTFSPIFFSPGKGAPLGVRKLRKALLQSKKTIALGGIISKKEIHKIKRSRALGFASIRYFL